VIYTVVIESRVEHDLRGLPPPPEVSGRLPDAADMLAGNPRPRNSKRLSGALTGLMRPRVGRYRAVYSVDDAAMAVRVLGAGSREVIYEPMVRRMGG